MGYLPDTFRSRTDDAQHTTRLPLHLRKVVLLNGFQSFGRSRIASQYHQMATQVEEFLHGFTRKLIHDLERTCPVGCAGIISQIKIIILRHQLTNLMQDGQSAVTGVEHSDRPRLFS